VRLRAIIVMGAVIVVLGVLYLVFGRQAAVPSAAPQGDPPAYVWNVDMDEITVIAISLPRGGKRRSWVKHEDRYWYFDEPNGPRVNMERWGGGIPLLLSGPGAERRITDSANNQQLESYGLAEPQMLIELTLQDAESITIEVGDATLDGQAYYVSVIDHSDVYTVDYTWYDVLERLVLDPPYPESSGE